MDIDNMYHGFSNQYDYYTDDPDEFLKYLADNKVEETPNKETPSTEETTYTVSNSALNVVFTAVEKQQFIKGKCLECGKQGYYAQECPIRWACRQ